MYANLSQKRLSKHRGVVVPASPPPLLLGAEAIARMEQQFKATDGRKPKTASPSSKTPPFLASTDIVLNTVLRIVMEGRR